MWQGNDRISRSPLMVRFAHEDARYTKIHFRYNVQKIYLATLWIRGAIFHNFYRISLIVII
jgi:hypothetical protein